jgi:hypothetical protein
MKDKNQIFTFKYTHQEHKDAGMACVLLMLILGWLTGNHNWFFAAIPVLFVAMAIPAVCYPFSLVWYNLSLLLGNIMSKVILSLIFFLLVVPVGIIRKMAGKDPLKLRESGDHRDSAFMVRNKRFSATDLSKPY